MATELRTTVEELMGEYDSLLRRAPDHSGADKVGKEEPEPNATPAGIGGSKDPITRPNGEKYVPRTIADIGGTDVRFIEVAYENKMPVLLTGPPGTGKTALLEAALPGLITLQGTAETETADFIGSYVQRPDGMYEWIDGPLVRAADEGKPFLVDEIALVDARVMSVAYAVMDGRREIVVTANPARGTVVAKDGFVVYGACNPNVPGAVMSDALLSRFTLHVEVNSDWALAKTLGCGTKIVSAAMNLNAKLEAHELTSAPQLREVLDFVQVEKRFGQKVALRNLLSSARVEDRATYTEVVRATFGDDLTPLTF